MLTLLPVAIENEQADGNLPWLQDFASFRINSAERVVGARMDAAAVSAETTERGCSGGNYSYAGSQDREQILLERLAQSVELCWKQA